MPPGTPQNVLRYCLCDSRNDRFQQADELPFHTFCCLQHFQMVERLIQNSRRRICHAGDPQHSNAALPRSNHFPNRGHTHKVCADRPVGEDHSLYAHSRENADGKGHLLRRITFVKMDAALHPGNGDCSHFSDDEFPRMANSGRLRKVRNFLVWDFGGFGKFVRKSAKARAENKHNLRSVSSLGKNEVSRFSCTFVLAGRRTADWGCSRDISGGNCFRSLGRGVFLCDHVRIPTMEADIKFAMVPASMARMPNFASWLRCSGASAPMPPIWMPMELKFAKPQRAKVAIAKVRGSSAPFIGPSWPKATNSLITMRVPRRLPIFAASCQGTPISQATGAKIQPKTVCRLSRNQAM